MMAKQDKITDCLVNTASFHAHRQILNNYIVENDKFLTAHMSKCMFWKDKPSDYISRGDKYLSNSVVYDPA